MGTVFFFVAMVFGVLPFVTSLILGRPMQALVAGANVRASIRLHRRPLAPRAASRLHCLDTQARGAQ
jgi:hypothetical protein